MRKLLILIILYLLLSSIAQAQEPHKVYLPFIMKFVKDDLKNAWQIVKPASSTNYVLNPSAETTGNFTAVGSATITRSTTYAKYGLSSYHIQTFATSTGLTLTLGTLTNSDHWFTLRVRGNLPKELRLSIGPDSKKAIYLERIDDYWSLYGAMFGASESNGATSARISQHGAGSGDFYIDGVQIEPLGSFTTYVDGTQDGCEWNGIEHGSTSSRSGEYIGGGTPQDLYQEYKFFVTRIVGAGAATQTLGIDSYAILPGGEMNSIKTEPRQFTLIGKFITDTEMELHDARQDLIGVLKLATPGQPLKLRFNGGRVQKEISVFYQGGLEGDLAAFYGNFEAIEDNQWGETSEFVEKATIQFSAPDPYWYEVGESAASLDNASDTALYSEQDTNESATFRAVAGRLRSTGQWSNLGPPNSAGTYTLIWDIAEDDTYVYFAGDFLNFDNIANADYIVRYNKQTGAYSALSTGTNNIVYALALGPDGTLYLGGDFTLAGGVAGTVSIAAWNGTVFRPLSTGANNGVFALAVGLDGTLYAGGSFTTMGGVFAVRLAAWNGTTWSAVGGGVNGTLNELAIGIDGSLYVGGDFLLAGGVANTVRIARYFNGAFTPLSTGANDEVHSLAVAPNGTLYAGGEFTTIGGISASKIAAWNGTTFAPLGAGANNTVYGLKVGPDGTLILAGIFTSAGGISISDRIARWNGYTFAHFDIDLPGSPTVIGLLASKYVDPVIRQKYDIYIGFSTAGIGSYAGKTIVNNEGNVPAFPQIVYYRSGGTYAIIETLRNERTGKELLYDYRLLDGETLITDLTPTNKSITSSFFGPRLDAILPNSDFGTWQLLPGNNDVTTFVPVSGGPTMVAYLLWRDKFDSWD